MIEAVQKRIKELEKSKEQDEHNEDLRMQEKVNRLLQAQKAQQGSSNQHMELTEEELEELAEGFDVEDMEARMAADEKDDIIGMAKSVLNDEDSMKKVHSTKSVAAIAKKTKNDYDGEVREDIVNPKIVTIQEDDHSRVKPKGPSRLAYLNRNPAV